MQHAILATIAALLFAIPHQIASAATGQSQCETPDGWSEIAERDPDFVVFGELHGTKEAPEFVENLVCALATKGERVLLAIEFTASHDSRLQEAWAVPHQDFQEALLNGGWEIREDGVGSAAMMQLVMRAHFLKSVGYNVDIAAFNGARNEEQRAKFAELPGQGPHEAAQAENIASAAQRSDYDRVIVLVGSLHAEKLAITMGGTTFEPMARKLASYGLVISLNIANAPGSSWSCQLSEDVDFVPGQPLPPGAVVCNDFKAGGSTDLEHVPYISLGAFPGRVPDPRYDGFFWVGPVTASPPALTER